MVKCGVNLFLILMICSSGISQTTSNAQVLPTLPRFEIVENKAEVGLFGGLRSVYVYLEKDTFTLGNVSTIVQNLREQYCNPYYLDIVVFSDKKMLEWQAMGDKAPHSIDFDLRTEAGRLAAARHYKKIYPPGTGYLRAHYTRGSIAERLRFSRDEKSLELETYVIHDPTGSAKSETHSNLGKSQCPLPAR